MSENLMVIKDTEAFLQLSDYIKDFEYIAFDTETTGVHKGAEVIGFSICAESDVAFYVVLSYWCTERKQLIELETSSFVKKFFKQLQEKKLIAHNAIFDCSKIYDIYKVDLMPSVHTDTMLLAHLLDESRRNGLKELGASVYGQSAVEEKLAMQASVANNGGGLTKKNYELYKGDPDLIGVYGAKDALLTFNLFYEFLPQLMDQDLDKFFYDDECMPLLRGPSYELNTVGLKVDTAKLQQLRAQLEMDIAESGALIAHEIKDLIKDKYPATKKSNTFNINAGQQLAWLLFERLGRDCISFTEAGKSLAKALSVKLYSKKDQRAFIALLREFKGQVWAPKGSISNGRPLLLDKKIGDPWQYMCTDVDVLEAYAPEYKWVHLLATQKKNIKTLSTYVMGIQERVEYGIIRPRFNQIGTTSGRYSSTDPNFQNLPRDDKRIKECIISRPGMVFIGADYSQLEPRVFASVSQDPRLLECFAKGEDFYSVVGAPIFGIKGCSLFKDEPGSFAVKHKALRNMAKAFALATPYGTSAYRQASELGKSVAECQDIIDKYFASYPKVEAMMLESHEMAKKHGVVHSLYGRPRRIPEAKNIPHGIEHGELPYEMRTLLNLGMNHRVQSSAASIVNRAAIAFYKRISHLGLSAKIVLQVHDELVIECKEGDAEFVAATLKDCMENTTTLPGVALIANPVIAKNLGDLK